MTEYTRENRIKEALIIREMKQTDLVAKTGLSKGAINNWIKQRWQPKQNAIMVMAQALEVSEMWLAGYDVPMERPPAQRKMDELAQFIHVLRKNERLMELCINISKLKSEHLAALESMVQALSSVNSVE